ncbi:MAG: RsbRD N-terminal domain-containing protein [Gracilibacteraceae bacterium]|jgi:hypothetical protein|nr:RsbRD N-terminal domain-containing protein [Gracilibacteraceae bacterium]
MQLSIYDVLEEKKPGILKRWRQAIAGRGETEPFAGAPGGSRFTNPARHTVEQAAADIFAWLTERESPAELKPVLRDICQLKAVQDAAPGQALAFIFELKDILDAELTNSDGSMTWSAEVRKIERRIDEIMLTAFDLYAEQQRRISDIRLAEMKRARGREAV